jgi:uncharacterized protein YdeI (YjbR/CyaY-like superfamily)
MSSKGRKRKAGDALVAAAVDKHQCSMCIERFDAVEHVPRLLTCGHHFCSKCLTSSVRKSSARKWCIACPTCQDETSVASGNVAALPEHSTVASMEWVEFGSRQHLRDWLAANLGRSVGVWAVYPKTRRGASDLSWETLVEECLCFGWIDSTAGKVDDLRTRTYISPRRRRSGWSRRNQTLVDVLLNKGLMHESGIAAVAAAKADGSWSLFDLAEDLIIPQVLEQAFAADPRAKSGIDEYPARTRKSLLQWYYTARTDVTRQRRSAAIAEAASQGVRPKGF